MEKVLLTGCAGFIGHHLARSLANKGIYVVGVDNLSEGNIEYTSLVSKFLPKEVGEIDETDIDGVDTIFHMAALPKVPYTVQFPVESNDTNLVQTLTLLNLAARTGVKKFVFSSTCAVYGDAINVDEHAPIRPQSPYAVQKAASDLYCKVFSELFGLKTVSLRYFNVFGEEQEADNPYSGVVTKFINLKREQVPLTVYGTGEQTRDFVYVGDVVQANLLAAESEMTGVYNVGTGVPTSVNEIVKKLEASSINLDARPGDPLRSYSNPTKLLATGWKPTVSLLEWLSTPV